MRNIKDYLILTIKGMAMGAADVVPGVSGGTIAFITGIYEELIDTISSVNLEVLKTLKKEGLKAAWNALNGNFIVAIFLGIGISIASLAKLISYLLVEHPILIWSFFFGLVIASVVYVGKQVKKWNTGGVIGLILGTVVAFYITILPPMAESTELWFIFVSGMIAICAMILPGISGSFILLILGSYETVLGAVKDKDFVTIGVFMGGCIIGLLSFSRLLKWMFAKFHDITIAVLTGFLIGSLNKIWPWKVNKELLYTHSNGKQDFLQENVLPVDAVGEPQIMYAVAFCLLGAGLIFGMEIAARKMKKS